MSDTNYNDMTAEEKRAEVARLTRTLGGDNAFDMAITMVYGW